MADSPAQNYAAHPASEGLGPVGATVAGPVGLWFRKTLALTPAGVPIGLIGAQHWQREPAQHGKKRTRSKRPSQDKESGKWLKSSKRIEALQRACPQTRWVMVADRESDIYQLFATVRDATAKLAGAGTDESQSVPRRAGPSVVSAGRGAGRAGTLTVEIAAGNSQRARDAAFTVHTRAVTRKPPRSQARLRTIAVHAVRAHEEHPPEDSAAREWMLLTTVRTTTFGEG